jgi:hypothetical protein
VVLKLVTLLPVFTVIQQIMHANSFHLAQTLMGLPTTVEIASVDQRLALLLLEGFALQVLIRVSPKLPAQTLI